ncbi:hypothetical protein Bca4012_059246 [Brassica carinata]
MARRRDLHFTYTLGDNYAVRSTFKKESKSSDPICVEGSFLNDSPVIYANRVLSVLVWEERSEISTFLWKPRFSDPIKKIGAFILQSFLESSRNPTTQSTPYNLCVISAMECFNQSQKSAVIMGITTQSTIKRGALEIISHYLLRSKFLSSYQISETKMPRHFERAAPKRNSALNLDPIVIDAFDNSDLLAAYDLTLVGRVLNSNLQAHRVKALLALMPQAWQLEGRVQGIEVGRGKFHFRFDNEGDLHSVLEKRPFFFDQWMFPLERWVPSVRTDFPSTMIFTVFIEGIPEHYLKEPTVKGIGEKLGELISWDVKKAKVRVSVECEKPLQFERRLQFSSTGDEVVISFQYEKLQKWCFICNRMTHDGKRCPELEKERAHVSKYGYKDRNLRQQDILRGELSPYNGHEKAPKQQNVAKLPINRKLFDEKEASPKPKQGRSSDKTEKKRRKHGW